MRRRGGEGDEGREGRETNARIWYCWHPDPSRYIPSAGDLTRGWSRPRGFLGRKKFV